MRGESEHDRWTRDLRWAISSPLLMRPSAADEGDFSEPIDCGERGIEGEEIVGRFIEKYSGYRVGYYFENLIYYWLKHVCGVEILAQGFQVLHDGRTLGELDFVFRDESGEVHHWEVAAKFYLYGADQQIDGSHFIGPNARDTFERKRDKLFGRQLPLSETVFPEVSHRSAFVKGRIFYHPQQAGPEILPDGLMPNHLRGTWLRHADLSWLEGVPGIGSAAYHLAEKPNWLAPECFSVAERSPLNFSGLGEHLDAHFAERNQPVLLSALVREGDRWTERERVFVVADTWPEV